MIKLSKWAKQHGVTYNTAFSWFSKGVLPVKSIQLETGTILVEGFEDDGAEPKYSQEQLNEVLKCANDSQYFIKEYLNFKDNNGNVVEISNIQDEILGLMCKHKKIAVMKPRQRGVSTISLAYCLWYALFHYKKVVAICGHKLDNSTYLLTSLVDLFKTLPDWMKHGANISKRRIEFASGSEIRATMDMKALSVNLLYVDEYSFHGIYNSHSYVPVEHVFTRTENIIVVSSLRESMSDTPDLFLNLWDDTESGFYNHRVEAY